MNATYVLHKAEQQPHERVDQYIIRLRRLAERCDFKGLHHKVLWNQLVLGCCDKATRARLFRQKECTLKTALEALQISEWTGRQLKQIATEEQESMVNVVSTDRKYGKHAKGNDTKTFTGLEIVHC